MNSIAKLGQYTALLKKINSVIIFRYVLYVIIGLETLLLPKLFSGNTYTEIEYLKSLAFLFPYVLMGSSNGYLYYKYNYKKDFFNVFLSIGLLFGLIFLPVIGLIYKSIMLPFICLVTLLFVMIEQKVKTEKYFTLSFIFKPLISLILIAIGVIVFYTSKWQNSPQVVLLIAYLITCISWIWYVKMKIGFSYPDFKSIRRKLSVYSLLVKQGFFGTLGTLLISLFLFSDRFFIKHYYPHFLGSFSFAFNLSQIVILTITTLSYISTVTIGEERNKISNAYIKKTLKETLIIFFFLFFLQSIAMLVISKYYNFDKLIEITLLITVTKGLFYCSTVLSPIVLYFDYQTKVTWVLLALFVLNIGLSYLCSIFNFSILIFLSMSGFSLIIYSIYIMYIIFKKIKY